jgi:hypothetical protein
VPTSVQQVAIVLVLVLPGVFYLAARERLLGPRPSDGENAGRLVRLLAVSALLDAVYLLVAGRSLVGAISGPSGNVFAGVAAAPRLSGLLALVMIVLVPTGLAWVEAWFIRRSRQARYRPAPTAWDSMFAGRGSCFVRARLRSGLWVGGWYGGSSSASAYPHQTDLYLQAQYAMNPDGTFGSRIEGTAGVYLRGEDIEVLEILEP